LAQEPVIFLSVAKQNGWQTIGVEPSDKAKVIALKEVSFVEDTAELQNQSFDVISMWHVLEHVPNLDNQIIETIIKTKWFIDR
jgi:predicted CoA-binding protein